MVNNYSYIDTAGKNQTIQADNPDLAIKNATNRAPTSGVQLETAPTIPMDTLTQPTTAVKIPPPPTTVPDTSSQDLFSQYINNQPAPVNTSDIYAQANKDAGIEQKTQVVNDLASQLDKINKDATVAQQTLESQSAGRDVTSGFLGKQQQEVARQATIKGLPISAQLNAAQGNLKAAQDNVNTLYKLKSEDAQNQFNYKTQLVKSVYEFATKEQQRKLDAIQREDDRKFALEKDQLNFDQQKELAKYNSDLRLSEDRASAALTGAPVTITGKPQNASQSSANGYADRLNQSNIVIDTIGGNFTGKLDFGGSLPNAFQSGERQSYEQAKRNFITAVLRRESGAAISPTEFDTEALKYFPQAGDKASTVKQKADARNTAINNIYREANVLRPVLPGQIIESNGKKYKVESDGQTLTELK